MMVSVRVAATFCAIFVVSLTARPTTRVHALTDTDLPTTVEGLSQVFQHSVQLNDVEGSQCHMFWTILDETAEIEFAVAGQTTGWVAFGSSDRGLMIGSIASIAWKDSEGSTMKVFSLDEKSVSGMNEISTVVLKEKGVIEVDGWTVLSFKRSLIIEAWPLAVDDSDEVFVWALGPDDELTTHFADKRGSATVNLRSGQLDDVSHAKMYIHGSFMWFAWGVLAPLGVTAAVFRERLGPAWFVLHQALVQSALFFTGIAALIAINRMVEAGNYHFASPHSALGLVVLIISFFQVSNGELRAHKDADLRPKWEFLHHWTGRTTLILAALNVFLGIAHFSSAVPGTWIEGLYYAHAFFLLIFMVTLVKKRMGAKSKDPAPVT